MSSRLDRIRSKRESKQGLVLMLVSAVLVVVMIFWGLPAIARFASTFVNNQAVDLSTPELKPTPPIIADIPEATFSAKVSIAGFAQPGIDVILYMNGAELGRKLTTDAGTFEFADVPITEGDNVVYGYTATQKNLRSEKSKEYVIQMDDKEPTVTIDSPKDGDVFRGNVQRMVTIKGGVNEVESKVYIGERMVIVSTDGTFSLPYQLAEGDQEIMIKAKDKAGNESEMMLKLRWEP